MATSGATGRSADGRPCPCGSGRGHAACCGPYLDRMREAPTAEALMRARYCAHATGDVAYLAHSWHPDTRPPDVHDPGVQWLGLEVQEVARGGALDREGTVSFVARYRSAAAGAERGVLAERSRFARLGMRWVYVDGDVLD